MSLFKTRTFWKSVCENEEFYDQNSLIVTKLNSSSDFIVTGSQSGILRIFKPSSELNEDQILSDYKATDLLIEQNFDYPILQIASGKLVSGSNNLQIAILHPKLLLIYSLITKEGATEHGNQNILKLMYEHKLRRSSYNFVLGPFGGNQNRDFICVQSLDGLLTFFEQETFVFCCFLPDFLLPGPLIYINKSDSFITSTSNWCITSFKYKFLFESGQNSNDDSSKKVHSDWSYNLGEPIIDLNVLNNTNSKENCILILGERNLFCLNENGKIKYMKKLDYSPICFTNYILNDNIASLIISETSTLLIYHNVTLKWSAQLPYLPISIKRAFLKNINGVIVLLTESGILECCYLGSEPILFVAPPLKDQDLDFEQAGSEIATLNKIIKNSYRNDIDVTNASAQRELSMNISINPHLETCIFENNLKSALNNQMCSISINVIPQAPFEEVQISLFVQQPLKVVPQNHFFTNLCDRNTIKSHVFINESTEIASLNLQVVASFVSNLGVPRSVVKNAMLPLNLVAETCQALKESEHKITLNINQPVVSLANLFPEFAGENLFTSTSNAVGFKNVTGEGKIVSILLAKSSERYRLQSDSFASLSLLIEQMIHRLKNNATNTSNDFSISFTNSPLPITEVTFYINNHFKIRQQFNKLQDELSQFSAQFRLIQKRLISKYKIKNPTPLNNLELLLQDTFNEIMKTAEKLEEEQDNLIKAQTELSCALHILVNIIKIMNIDNNLVTMIESTFCTNIYDLENQNWEDTIDASLCYLLRTVLAKSEKDKLRAAHTSFEEIKEISKVEKHFSQVLERIPKRGVLETHFSIDGDPNKEPVVTNVNTSNNSLTKMPIGSQIGESSSRLLSAKKGLLRKRHKIDNEE